MELGAELGVTTEVELRVEDGLTVLLLGGMIDDEVEDGETDILLLTGPVFGVYFVTS